MTPTQQAADVLAATVDFLCPTCHHHYVRHYQQSPGCRHCRFPRDGSAPAACTETMTSALAGSFAVALAAAGVLTDPDTHDRDAVNRVRALAQRMTAKAATLAPEDDWGDSMEDTVAADALRHCANQITAALDGAGTDAHGEGA